MTPATIAIVSEIIQLLVAAASESLLKSNTDPTPEQHAAIRAALDAANAALQAA